VKPGVLLRYLALTLVALVTLGPFVWLVVTALKGSAENIFAYPPRLIPEQPTLGNFAAVWAAKRDPLFVEVGRRHLRIPGQLSV